MQQATDQTRVTASPEIEAPQDRQADLFDHAASLAAWYFRQLTGRPYATELAEDFPTGYQVHLKFRSNDVAGLLQFAELVDAPVTRATTDFGVHLDVYARIQNVLLRGSALLSCGEAARLDAKSPRPNPLADATTEPETVTVQPAPEVLPLGSISTANQPATAPAVDGEQ
ncbi:hypothetical protein [Streptomyces sp. NPDC047070]|uniref:hypothetical protein n=1 Tax=Streptomyces sp. NPDC047070 TaxID=3154923 RepID=UPI003454363A